MCIRDRAHPYAALTPDVVMDALSSVGLQGDGRLTALSSYAVSYTHLRAHETVLDLVCRLLLEKKKT